MRARSSSSAAKATSAPWHTRAGGRGEAGVERVEEGRGALGHEAGAEPAVGDLPGEPQHLRRHRGQVDRDVGVRGGRQAHRPALTAGKRDREVLARVGDPLARERHPDDLDRLPGARARRGERDAVQPLHHLRPGRAEAEQEPSLGHVGERQRRLRDRDRRAGAELDDPGPQQQPAGAGGEEPEGRRGVRTPRLGDPADVEAQLLRLDHELDRLPPVPLRGLDGGGRAH
jgi:hypothetical protein